MGKIMEPCNFYDIYGSNTITFEEMQNKLLCTFVPLEYINTFVDSITRHYTIQYNKIFVLQIANSPEYACTYNIDIPNVTQIPENSILVHRKKHTRTLYTINALNELVKSLNKGVADTSYQVDWEQYRNTLILTQQTELKFLRTKIYKIIEV